MCQTVVLCIKKFLNVSNRLNRNKIPFDLCSLFASILVNIALIEFEKYLNNCDITEKTKYIFLKAAKLCMKHIFFQFRNQFPKVEYETNMGNPLSP